jgi:hypothetical protein
MALKGVERRCSELTTNSTKKASWRCVGSAWLTCVLLVRSAKPCFKGHFGVALSHADHEGRHLRHPLAQLPVGWTVDVFRRFQQTRPKLVCVSLHAPRADKPGAWVSMAEVLLAGHRKYRLTGRERTIQCILNCGRHSTLAPKRCTSWNRVDCMHLQTDTTLSC